MHQLVPPETTAGEVVVVVGAVVVVGEAVLRVAPGFAVLVAVDAAPEPDVAEADVEVEVESEAAWTAATVLDDAAPGISLATSPPRTAAASAAPPVAIPVMRLTRRRAAVLCSA
jgi:hypothetical protein